MTQPDPAPSNAAEWTVSELSGALRRTLEDRFGLVRVRGELGKVSTPSSGHIYLDLKDEGACLAGVIWRTSAAKLRVRPEAGMEVIATGRLTTFPGQSKYQLVIETIEPAGLGALMALLEERRRRLAAEGLFAAERKRPLPFLPAVIGVVTSPSGAVIHDILHRLADRFPSRVLLWPVRVQGETTGREVAAAIAGFGAFAANGDPPRPGVVIVARGGGSLEDLWGFNDEEVVRAAAASAVPLVSAVGHETDWTLLDHAADLRAPTPTAAAEMVVPVRHEIASQAAALALRLTEAAARGLDSHRTALRAALRARPGPDGLLGPRRQRLDLAATRLAPALSANARDGERRLHAASAGLARHAPRIALATARERLSRFAALLAAGRAAAIQAERVRIGRARDRLGHALRLAERAAAAGGERRAARLRAASGLLASLGYRSVLARGYVIVRDADGHPVARAASVAAGQELRLEFADGVRQVVEGGDRRRPEPARPRRRETAFAQDSLFDL